MCADESEIYEQMQTFPQTTGWLSTKKQSEPSTKFPDVPTFGCKVHPLTHRVLDLIFVVGFKSSES